MEPLHQPYPWHFPDATMMILTLSCDHDALAAALPDGLELADPATVMAWTLHCEAIAGVGAYREFMVNTVATSGDRTIATTPFIYVDNDASMASGREVLGMPKRIAEIDQQFHTDQLVARVRRAGVEFVTLGMTLDREGDQSDRDRTARWLGAASLNRARDGTLIEGGMDVDVTRVVHGRGFIDVRPSAADPLHRLRPVATRATYVRGSLTLLATRPAGGD